MRFMCYYDANLKKNLRDAEYDILKRKVDMCRLLFFLYFAFTRII